jgi:ferredoxin
MRVEVDFDECEANGVCVEHAPTVFSLDDDDQLHITGPDVPPELAEQVRAAVAGCPKRALSLSDDS